MIEPAGRTDGECAARYGWRPPLSRRRVPVPGAELVCEDGAMLSLDEAQRLCAAARDAATAMEVAMSFAVMDAAGHLLALARMDDALWVSADVAQGKAWTAAAYGQPSEAQRQKAAALPSFATALSAMTQGRYTPQTGAVPVYRDGRLLGALGASGGTGEQDEAVCSAAVSASGFDAG